MGGIENLNYDRVILVIDSLQHYKLTKGGAMA